LNNALRGRLTRKKLNQDLLKVHVAAAIRRSRNFATINMQALGLKQSKPLWHLAHENLVASWIIDFKSNYATKTERKWLTQVPEIAKFATIYIKITAIMDEGLLQHASTLRDQHKLNYVTDGLAELNNLFCPTSIKTKLYQFARSKIGKRAFIFN